MANEVIKIVFKVDDKEVTVAEKNVEKLSKEVEETAKTGRTSASQLKGAFGLMASGAAVAGAAVVAFGKQTLDAAREIDTLSKRAGLTAEAFQRQAFAAKQVGIEQDKYSDIILDVNDKIGDFLNTGAGPLVDFFDTVGKKVGVTADDFKGLSGDQALGLYIDTLDKANVNQQEMTFFMEALASDATALAPLFANGAEQLDKFGEAAGNVLSQDQIDRAQELNRAMDTFVTKVGNDLKGAFIDAATEAADFFGLLEGSLERNKLDALREQASEMGESLNELLDEGTMDERAQGIAKSFGIAYKEIGPWWNREFVPATDEAMRELQRRMSQTMQHGINEANRFEEKIVETAEAAADAATVGDPTGAGSGVTTRKSDEEEIAEIKVTAFKRVIPFAEKLAAIERERVQAEQDAADAIVAQKVEWGLLTDFASVHLQDLRTLQEYLAQGKITAEEYGQAIMNIAKGEDGEDNPWQGLTDELTSLETKMKEMKTDAIMGIADGFAEMAVSGKGNFKEMAASMLKDIAKLIIKTMLLRAIMSFIPGMSPAPTGGAANGGIIQPGQASFVGERGMEIIQPAAQSRVIPNHAMRMGGGNAVNVGSINVNIQEREGETSEEQAQRIGKAIRNEMRGLVITELNNQSRQGNMLNPNPIKAFR